MAYNGAHDRLVYDVDWNRLAGKEGSKVWMRRLGHLWVHSCSS